MESLCLFNEKVDQLYSSGFPFSAFAWSEKHDNTFMEISLTNGEITSIDMFTPNENELRSFILTYKVLTQKNDHCSLVNIANIYNKLPDTIEEKKKFNDFRNEINSFLESNSGISEKGIHLKRRMIVDYMINALYAHADESKKTVVEKWLSDPISAKFHNYEFIMSLTLVSDRLFQINILNESLVQNKSLFIN